MNTYHIYDHRAAPVSLDAEKVFVEDGHLHIVHTKEDAASVTIYPPGKWARVEYKEKKAKTNGRRKRPAEDSAA